MVLRLRAFFRAIKASHCSSEASGMQLEDTSKQARANPHAVVARDCQTFALHL